MKISSDEWTLVLAGFFGGFVKLCSATRTLLNKNKKLSRRDFFALALSIVITSGGVFLSIFICRWLKTSYEQSIIISYMAGYLSHNLFKYIDRKQNAVCDQIVKRIK